ncbi:hypothetical protein C8J57DRAFT_1437074 [Mycena rebaudengoi]|nr:hypothetical protein C8J57DRAFT_1437074 [Mycena rebaudengoi]
MLASAAAVYIASVLALLNAFAVLGRYFPAEKQRAWVLTTIASCAMTAASLPFMRDYLTGWGIVAVQPRVEFAVVVNRFFQAYLLTDLTVGALYYRSQIGLLTGWVHHAVYILITEIAIRNAWAHIFCLCAIMELPTLLLGLMTLLPSLRSNTLFALVFFATRILFHLVLLASYALPAHRPAGSLFPALILASVFPLHAMWFVGCVQGFLRRFKASSSPPTPPRHPLAPDIHPDSRSLARHTFAPHARPRDRVIAALPSRDRVRAARASVIAASRDTVLQVLPSRERVMDYVGMAR